MVGDAGVGKSRLAAEFLASVEAPIVAGRCLPYGEGITYWPVVEVVKQLDALPSDPAAAASLRSLLGETDEGTAPRRSPGRSASCSRSSAPLVCVFDDIQWARRRSSTWWKGSPSSPRRRRILLLCMARPDLSERRPAWPVPLRLEPLATRTPSTRCSPRRFPRTAREQIARAAGGNPLFITEMLAMARETEGEVTRPAHPAGAARRPPRPARAAPSAPCSSVARSKGEVFHRGAVQALGSRGDAT